MPGDSRLILSFGTVTVISFVSAAPHSNSSILRKATVYILIFISDAGLVMVILIFMSAYSGLHGFGYMSVCGIVNLSFHAAVAVACGVFVWVQVTLAVAVGVKSRTPLLPEAALDMVPPVPESMADILDCIFSEPLAVALYIQVKEAALSGAIDTGDPGPDTYDAEPVPPIVRGKAETFSADADPVLFTVIMTDMSLPTVIVVGTDTADESIAVSGVFVTVGVAVLVYVRVFTGVFVAVLTWVNVCVAVSGLVTVNVGVDVRVQVCVNVGVNVGVNVLVDAVVEVMVIVGVAVLFTVSVTVGVAVSVGGVPVLDSVGVKKTVSVHVGVAVFVVVTVVVGVDVGVGVVVNVRVKVFVPV